MGQPENLDPDKARHVEGCTLPILGFKKWRDNVEMTVIKKYYGKLTTSLGLSLKRPGFVRNI